MNDNNPTDRPDMKSYLFRCLVEIGGITSSAYSEEETLHKLSEAIAAEYGEPPEQVIEFREATEEELFAAQVYMAGYGDGPTSVN